VPRTAISAYQWGKILNFTTRGSALPYCVQGWSEPEPGLIWTDGLNAKLSFSISAPKSDISLALTCEPFLVEGKIPYQELNIFINFLRVGFAFLDKRSEITLEIPKRVFCDSQCDIDLYLPKACSPSSVGAGPDIRILGIAMSRLMLAEA
jgi:hypothetical protein